MIWHFEGQTEHSENKTQVDSIELFRTKSCNKLENTQKQKKMRDILLIHITGFLTLKALYNHNLTLFINHSFSIFKFVFSALCLHAGLAIPHID